MFQVYLAEHRVSTNWGETKSNQHKSNQIKCWFLVRGENQSTWRKTSHSRVENQQTQPTYDVQSANRTRATLVEGQCSHHCANPAPMLKYRIQGHLFSSHSITKVPIVLQYFVLQKISAHVKQVIQLKCPCTSSHKLDRTKMFTLAFKLDATYFHINYRCSLCLSYNLPPLQPFTLGSYVYAI